MHAVVVAAVVAVDATVVVAASAAVDVVSSSITLSAGTFLDLLLVVVEHSGLIK